VGFGNGQYKYKRYAWRSEHGILPSISPIFQ